MQLAHSPRARAASRPTPAPAPTQPLYTVERPGRYGKVISHTVERWARTNSPARPRDYKPLVFRGTFPIDEPASPPAPAPATAPAPAPPRDPLAHRRELRRTIERSLDKFEAMLARRNPAANRRTFDIDRPIDLAEPCPDPLPKDRDARYYVSGPKTFDIDEPVSFM